MAKSGGVMVMHNPVDGGTLNSAIGGVRPLGVAHASWTYSVGVIAKFAVKPVGQEVFVTLIACGIAEFAPVPEIAVVTGD